MSRIMCAMGASSHRTQPSHPSTHPVHCSRKLRWVHVTQLLRHVWCGGPHHVAEAVTHGQQRQGASGQEALPRGAAGH